MSDVQTISWFGGEHEFLSNFYGSWLRLDDLAGGISVSGEPRGLAHWRGGRSLRAWRDRHPHGAMTAEHVFQALKTTTLADADRVLYSPSPGAAKKLGRRLPLRPDWEQVKVPVMLAVLREKFNTRGPGLSVGPVSSTGEYPPTLHARLVATHPSPLVEGNTWGDAIWGTVDGRGRNLLGRLLMLVRQELVVAQVAGIPVEALR